MARVRIGEVVAVAAVAASLAACSSSTSKPSATAAPTATPPAAASSTTSDPTSVSTSSSNSSGGSTIASLLAGFGAGDITTTHMPTADSTWVARIQTENQKYKVPEATDTKVLNLMALVDEAAREKDTTSLARLCSKDCDPKQQAVLWAKPGALDLLSSLIEKAPMGEGTVLPDFLLFRNDPSFHNADDTAYGKLYDVTSPTAFFAKDGGVWTSFQNGTGGTSVEQRWMGLQNH